jgi:hypothetical protein
MISCITWRTCAAARSSICRSIAAPNGLAAVCRGTYGFVNHHGYLENGLPIDYGEGAAELLDAMLHPEQPGAQDLKAGIAEGDISRAYVEWLSLLRHISMRLDHPWKRWIALKEAAKAVLEAPHQDPAPLLPPRPAAADEQTKSNGCHPAPRSSSATCGICITAKMR